MIIDIPNEILDDIHKAFCYHDSEYEKDKITEKEFFEFKIIKYIKDVYEDFKKNIQSMNEIEIIKQNIQNEIQKNIDKIKIT